MSTLVFATNNAHKAKEVEQILGSGYTIKTLKEVGCLEDIAETEDTILGNAILKANYLKDNYGFDCFSEDTGLEVDALGGRPGVHTARYAGDQRSATDNINLLLHNLKDADTRTARFRTVIAIQMNGTLTTLEGVCEGTIATECRGEGGFGYDPVFMGDDVKNKISHRGIATLKLMEFLK
jgi:XTP/dITP diphosphohydrolase